MTTSRRPILLVEDDEDLVACLRAVLESEGRPVIAVEEGEAALAACELQPLVAFVDLHIPGELSGASLVSALRQKLAGRARVFLLSAERDLALRARELGADGGLEKPFDIDDLLRIIRDAAVLAGDEAPSQSEQR